MIMLLGGYILDIVVIGNESLIIGFRLAGVKEGYLVDENSVNETFEEVMGKDNVGIVIMDNKCFEHLTERNKERAMTQVKPTVVVLSHDTSGEENLRLMIKRSIGVDLWEKE